MRPETGEPEEFDRGLVDHRHDGGQSRPRSLRLLAIGPTHSAFEKLRLGLDDREEIAERSLAGSDVGGRIEFCLRIEALPVQSPGCRDDGIVPDVTMMQRG